MTIKYTLYLLFVVATFAACRAPVYLTHDTSDTLIITLHDTLEHVVKERETIATRDSTHTIVVMSENGRDTLRYYETRYVERASDKTALDSLQRAIDRMQHEAHASEESKTVTKEVIKPLLWWQNTLMYAGLATLIAVLIKLLHFILTRTRARSALLWLLKHIRK